MARRFSDFNIENSFRCFIDQSTHSALLIELTQGPSPLILWMTWWQNTHPAALLPPAPVPLLTFPVTLPVSLLVICVVWVFTAPMEVLIRSGWWGSGPVGSAFSYADFVVLSQRLKVLLNFTFCSELLRRSWISSSTWSSNWGTSLHTGIKQQGCAGVFYHQSWEIWKVSPDQVLFSEFFRVSRVIFLSKCTKKVFPSTR